MHKNAFEYHTGSGFLQTVGNRSPMQEPQKPVVNIEVKIPPEKKKKPKQVLNVAKKNNMAQSYQGNPYIPASANSPKGLMKYFRNRNDDANDKFREKDSEQQKEQTDLLKKIEKKKNDGRDGSGIGAKSVLGALGISAITGAIVSGIKNLLNVKTKFGKINLAGAVLAVIDSAEDEIQRIADEQSVDFDEVGITTKLQGVVDMVGGVGVKAINQLLGLVGLDDYKINEDAVHQVTNGLRAKIEEKKNIFIENTGKFGEVVVGALSVADKGIGELTTYLTNATKVALDVFRKKSDIEKEFIKAQDTVRNREKFGDTPLIGASDKEYNQALKKMGELAPELLKDEDFLKNSIYKKVAVNTVSDKNNTKRKLTNKEVHKKKNNTKIEDTKSKISELKSDIKSLNEGGASGLITRFIDGNKETLEAELKSREHHLKNLEKTNVMLEESIEKLSTTISSISIKEREDRNTEREQSVLIIGHGGLGGLSAKYETRSGAGTVSTGKGDHGGVSYGTYQMSSNKGVVQDFVNQSKYANDFNGLTINSDAFKAKWKELAKNKDFGEEQHEYIKKTHYDELVNHTGIDMSKRSDAVKDVLWSTSVQHGGEYKYHKKSYCING